MAKQLAGQCAFPTGCDGDPGLTKREWLAGLAMQGILARGQGPHVSHDIASDAVSQADAMLEWLAAPQRG